MKFILKASKSKKDSEKQTYFDDYDGFAIIEATKPYSSDDDLVLGYYYTKQQYSLFYLVN